MKTSSVIPAILLLALLASGCADAPGLFATPSPVPTPTPEPTPVPVVALYGGEEDTAFARGVREAVDEAGFWFSAETGGPQEAAELTYEGACCAILRVNDDTEDLTAIGEAKVPVLLYQAGSRALPEGFPGVSAGAEDTAQALLNAALAYPPHDTPVRLLGLFESRDSAAFAAWDKGVAEGKILLKGIYVAAEREESPADWMGRKLSEYYPGMVDGIYTETAALACACANALIAADRSDMEVFSCGVDGNVRTLMAERPELLAAAAGTDPIDAGRACAQRAIGILRDGQNAEITRLSAQVYAAAEMD